MTIEIWIAFVIAVVVFCIIPGPTVLLVIAQALTHGRRSVIPLVAGVLCGDFVAFLPQFVSPATTAFPQLLLLMFTFLFIVAINIGFYTVFAGAMRQRVQSSRARRRLNWVGGDAWVGSGVVTATMQRA